MLPAVGVAACRQLVVHASDASGSRRIGFSVAGVSGPHIGRRPNLLDIQADALDPYVDDGCQARRMPGAIASARPGVAPARGATAIPTSLCRTPFSAKMGLALNHVGAPMNGNSSVEQVGASTNNGHEGAQRGADACRGMLLPRQEGRCFGSTRTKQHEDEDPKFRLNSIESYINRLACVCVHASATKPGLRH